MKELTGIFISHYSETVDFTTMNKQSKDMQKYTLINNTVYTLPISLINYINSCSFSEHITQYKIMGFNISSKWKWLPLSYSDTVINYRNTYFFFRINEE